MNTNDAINKQTQPVDSDIPAELSEDELSEVSGGVIRRITGGDDDLDDLEVER